MDIMQLSTEQVDDAAHEAGIDLDNVDRAYYGRGMLGYSTCIAIITRGPGLGLIFRFFNALIEQGAMTEDDAVELLDETEQDSLGHRTVYYWRRLRCAR